MKKNSVNNWKWITKLISIIFLALIDLLMIGSCIWMIAQLKSPPPDIEDLRFIFPILMPFYIVIGGAATGGLTWFAVKKHDIKEKDKSE